MPYYGKQEDLKVLMQRWIAAWSQQDKLESVLHPVTGKGYAGDLWTNVTCTCIVFTEFVDRLGVLSGSGEAK